MRFAISILLLILIWEAVVKIFAVPTFVFPNVEEVLYAAITSWETILVNLKITSKSVVLSFFLCIIGGSSLAIFSHLSSIAKSLLEPLVLISQLFPRVALAPVLVTLFGSTSQAKLAVAFLIAFFPIYEGVRTGLDRVDLSLIMQARFHGYSRSWQLLNVEIPLAMPYIFVGLKSASLFTVVGVIVAEFLASGDGVGLRIIEEMARGDTPASFAYICVVAITGAAFYSVVLSCEWLVLRKFRLSKTSMPSTPL